MSMYWIIFIGFALLSWLVSSRLQNKFEKYSKIPMPNGMTGKDVAEKMLHDNGIYDVKVISTPGHLTDHYNRFITVTVLLPQPLQLMNADTLSSMLRLMRLFGCVRLWFRSSALLPTL